MSGDEPRLEISRLVKRHGPLTKELSLTPEGKLRSDGSACIMPEGMARRAIYDNLADFAAEISKLNSTEAIALGALRDDLPNVVRVTTKDQLEAFNGHAPPDLISRTGDFIDYRPGSQALALIDIDTKGMPDNVKGRIREAGGYWESLVQVLPRLTAVGRVVRRSTSTGIFRTDNGAPVSGSDGTHVFVLVEDGADIKRFLYDLHRRCWLRGFGWMMVGAGGQLLERSIVDRMVYAPERLVFEGAPILREPLAQNPDGRTASAHEGDPLDTKAACHPLTLVEASELKVLHSRESVRLQPDSNKTRAAFIQEHGDRLIKRTGVSREEADRVIRSQTNGTLFPDVILPFDSPALAGKTVGDVLANPRAFAGETLADPLEGIDYGDCKAKIMLSASDTPWINSFAHGRTTYNLRYDARSIAALLASAPAEAVASTFTKLMANAEIEPSEAETLRDAVSERTGTGKRTLDKQVRLHKQELAKARAHEERDRRAAERMDHRPQITAPVADAPWLPQMGALNDVLGSSKAAEPPMRDLDGVMAQIRVRSVPDMHALTAGAANGERDETPLPPPEQPLLTRLSETQLAEMIERHIDYVDATGRSVHLASPFVRHFHIRTDDRLPTVAAISTLPLVIGDGSILSHRGLDRARGIVFRIPSPLMKLLPKSGDCSETAVAEAMRFLTDEWLADVATDYAGKATLIAAALTIMERALLPDRPAFFITAGRRGGGKTTTLVMLHSAVTGVRPSAAAWSTNEEERRKALLAYLAEAVPAIIWDNITRGTQISCPHIEKSCTAAFYSDRRLGVSELISVAASSIHFFTGNNIGPKGDMASRSLQVRLEIDRADPENREFRHPDPIAWTENNRGEILRALYTIMLGNPVLRPESDIPAQTRFKAWWRLVGSAVENASRRQTEHVAAGVMDATAQRPHAINFRDMFLEQEDDEEDNDSLAAALTAMAQTVWSNTGMTGEFKANDLAAELNANPAIQGPIEVERCAVLREFLFPNALPNHVFSSKGVGKALRRHVGEPVRSGDNTLILKGIRPEKVGPKGSILYRVEVV